MARPKSEDKRNAILDAATRVFAERGLTAAPTSEISRRAGVADGTLFTYFKTSVERFHGAVVPSSWLRSAQSIVSMPWPKATK